MMKNKPKVIDRIMESFFGISFDLVFNTNVIFLTGKSGNGKSFIFQALDEMRTYDARIETFNYKDLNRFSLDLLQYLHGKLIVIDNADILLNVQEREYIAFDDNNQYILIGRDPSDLMLTPENFHRVRFDEDSKTMSFSPLPLL